MREGRERGRRVVSDGRRRECDGYGRNSFECLTLLRASGRTPRKRVHAGDEIFESNSYARGTRRRRWPRVIKYRMRTTYRLKCSLMRSSRMFSGRFPTHRCRVSLTILLRTLHLGSDVVVSFCDTVQRHTTRPIAHSLRTSIGGQRHKASQPQLGDI